MAWPENLMSRLSLNGECVEFAGTKDDSGYGYLTVDGVRVRAHRAMYELMVGPIPEGLVIDHLCRNRACVNPGHLEPVTNRENLLRGEGPTAVNARKTHCVNGHEFTPENTHIERTGRRKCRACRRDWQQRNYQSKKSRAGASTVTDGGRVTADSGDDVGTPALDLGGAA